MFKKSNQAFSLVEMSIVLVVVGLLISTLTISTRLINNAKVRVVLQEIENYKSAVHTFRASFEEFPGDINNASDFFEGASDGDGDTIIEYDSVIESAYAWKHLELADVVNGNYAGSYTDGGKGSKPILNAPGSRYSGFGCYVFAGDLSSGNASEFTGIPAGENNITLGNRWYDNPCIGALLEPGDAESIDRKLDDGKPATGNIRGFGGQVNPAQESPAGSADSSSDCVASSKYKLTVTSPACILSFIL